MKRWEIEDKIIHLKDLNDDEVRSDRAEIVESRRAWIELLENRIRNGEYEEDKYTEEDEIRD